MVFMFSGYPKQEGEAIIEEIRPSEEGGTIDVGAFSAFIRSTISINMQEIIFSYVFFCISLLTS